MELASELYKERMIKTAEPEAAEYPKALCRQHCGTHIYFKKNAKGVMAPHDQATGKQHDCPESRKAKCFIGKFRMVRIDFIKDKPIAEILNSIEYAEEFCRKWGLAFDKWIETGIVPTSEEVESY